MRRYKNREENSVKTLSELYTRGTAAVAVVQGAAKQEGGTVAQAYIFRHPITRVYTVQKRHDVQDNVAAGFWKATEHQGARGVSPSLALIPVPYSSTAVHGVLTVSHGGAVRSLLDEEVLGPGCQVLQIEGHVVLATAVDMGRGWGARATCRGGSTPTINTVGCNRRDNVVPRHCGSTLARSLHPSSKR